MSIKGDTIDGFKYRSYKKPDNNWTDPFQEHDFWSRTFLPTGTEKIEAQDEAEMIKQIKAVKDIKFKEEELSKETKEIFIKEKIDDKIEKPPKPPEDPKPPKEEDPKPPK